MDCLPAVTATPPFYLHQNLDGKGDKSKHHQTLDQDLDSNQLLYLILLAFLKFSPDTFFASKCSEPGKGDSSFVLSFLDGREDPWI